MFQVFKRPAGEPLRDLGRRKFRRRWPPNFQRTSKSHYSNKKLIISFNFSGAINLVGGTAESLFSVAKNVYTHAENVEFLFPSYLKFPASRPRFEKQRVCKPHQTKFVCRICVKSAALLHNLRGAAAWNTPSLFILGHPPYMRPEMLSPKKYDAFSGRAGYLL